MEIWIGKHILIQILNIYWHQILLKVYFSSVQMLIKFLINRYHARHMPVPHQYQMPAPTTSTGPALGDQCRTSLSFPTYASTAPVVNFLLGILATILEFSTFCLISIIKSNHNEAFVIDWEVMQCHLPDRSNSYTYENHVPNTVLVKND